jgi:ABC-type transport system substrate-binding protein
MEGKRMKNCTTIICFLFVASLIVSTTPFAAKAETIYGPRIDELLIKIYGSEAALYAAFEACEVDLVDWPIGPTEIAKWTLPPYNDIITLDPFRETGPAQLHIASSE